MNIGAKADKPANYDVKTMKCELNAEKLEDPAIKNMILNKTSSAFDWISQRGNSGDNIPKQELDEFHNAILNDNAVKAVEFGVLVLETQMHPTARDIISDPIKQFVYNLCGIRAYKFEKDE